MKALIRTMRRAPGRVLASILAIGLAVGAIGVFAVPDVAAGTLRDSAARDQLAHIAVDTTALAQPAAIAGVDGVEAAETRTTRLVETVDHGQLRVVGFDPAGQEINIISATEGRLPLAGEAVVSDGVAEVGDTIFVDDVGFAVVGIGGTTWWSDVDALYLTEADAALVADTDTVRLLIRALDNSSAGLDQTVVDLRAALAAQGASFVSFPEVVPNGDHPIQEDLVTISSMIGLLGIVAGIVALILLASTASTLITERTREVAVMRALGAKRRPLRRRLRRLAVATAAGGLVLGIPLGIIVSNYVARMILERFVGVTPAIGVSWPVIIGSAIFALLGARIVAARSARRVTKLPLATALRDRGGNAWGRRFSDRVVSRVRLGGMLERLAVRNNLRSRGRTLSTVAQIAAGTGAILVVASLASSVNAFNSAEIEPWAWDETAIAADPGLPIVAAEVAGSGVEAAIRVDGTVGDWEVDVRGLAADTEMFDTAVRQGRWIQGDRDVVISQGFADHQGLAVGDTVDVELASGEVSYDVVGLHRSRARDLYVETSVLAADLNEPGRANLVYAAGQELPNTSVVSDVLTRAQMSAEDAAARDAIVAIFGAIGAIVAGVAALGVASMMAVSVHERRHEHAAMLAIGGTKRDVRRTLVLELLPLAIIGSALGAVAGWYGAAGIMGAFESANAVELGMVFASGAVLPTVAGALAIVVLIGVVSARRTARVPAAVTLRAAA